MILIDTSAWIEFLRDSGSSVCERVDELLASDIATCDPICMEVFAGARDEDHLQTLRRLLARASMLSTTSADYDAAAMLYRTCRARGRTVRKLIDCLIAAVALREGIPVLHKDNDFDVIAECAPLLIDRPVE